MASNKLDEEKDYDVDHVDDDTEGNDNVAVRTLTNSFPVLAEPNFKD